MKLDHNIAKKQLAYMRLLGVTPSKVLPKDWFLPEDSYFDLHIFVKKRARKWNRPPTRFSLRLNRVTFDLELILYVDSWGSWPEILFPLDFDFN